MLVACDDVTDVNVAVDFEDDLLAWSAKEYRVREMLRGLTAVHKWGLSGTPPLENGSAVAEVARLLGFASENKSEDASMMEQASAGR